MCTYICRPLLYICDVDVHLASNTCEYNSILLIYCWDIGQHITVNKFVLLHYLPFKLCATRKTANKSNQTNAHDALRQLAMFAVRLTINFENRRHERNDSIFPRNSQFTPN